MQTRTDPALFAEHGKSTHPRRFHIGIYLLMTLAVVLLISFFVFRREELVAFEFGSLLASKRVAVADFATVEGEGTVVVSGARVPMDELQVRTARVVFVAPTSYAVVQLVLSEQMRSDYGLATNVHAILPTPLKLVWLDRSGGVIDSREMQVHTFITRPRP